MSTAHRTCIDLVRLTLILANTDLSTVVEDRTIVVRQQVGGPAQSHEFRHEGQADHGVVGLDLDVRVSIRPLVLVPEANHVTDLMGDNTELKG